MPGLFPPAFDRRTWMLASLSLPAALLWGGFLSTSAGADEKPLNVAVVTTVWRKNSHCDVIAGRLLEGYSLNGQGEFPRLKLVSLYVDQVPRGDKSAELSQRFGFPIYDSVAKALTLGGDKLAVDGVLVIAEHGDYPKNESGSTQYPKRRLLGEVFQVFESSGRVVPVFSDKHLSDNWSDAAWIATAAKKLKVPFMAGSSVPTAWRHPATDVKRGLPLKEIVGVSYGQLEAYGFHALEMAQCLAERRQGNETGVKQVRALQGEAVWAAGREGLYDTKLLDETLARLEIKLRGHERPLPERVKNPVAYIVDYNDGLRVTILTLQGAVAEFACAWRYADNQTDSTLFWLQEGAPFSHFTYLLKNAEQMIATGKPNWPVERTLLTTGMLDALLTSHAAGGKIVATPYLDIDYTSQLDWTQPPMP